MNNPVLLLVPAERNPPASGRVPYVPDDLHVMVLAWQHEGTRAVALDIADSNRRAASMSCLTANINFTAALDSEERT